MNINVRKRLENHSQVNEKSECIEWTGSTSPEGYGYIKVTDRTKYAHRIAYEIHKGPIPKHCVVMHVCDNPRCINPDHLVAGSIADNVADKVATGRQARGEKNGRAKLRPRQVATIRRLHRAGRLTKSQLARQYSVDRGSIGRILSRKTWKHI